MYMLHPVAVGEPCFGGLPTGILHDGALMRIFKERVFVSMLCLHADVMGLN